jgi:hypothetical protein
MLRKNFAGRKNNRRIKAIENLKNAKGKGDEGKARVEKIIENTIENLPKELRKD